MKVLSRCQVSNVQNLIGPHQFGLYRLPVNLLLYKFGIGGVWSFLFLLQGYLLNRSICMYNLWVAAS